MILASRFTFIVERSWKNMCVHPKFACPPDAYYVIARNNSNWPSLNLSQNVREWWTNSCWKRQVLMFYPLGKNPYGGGHPTSPPPLVRPRLKKQTLLNSFCLNLMIKCPKENVENFPRKSFWAKTKGTWVSAKGPFNNWAQYIIVSVRFRQS